MKFLSAILLGLSFNAFADHHESKSLEESKRRILSKIQSRMERLQAAKTCVEGATDEDSVKVCKVQMNAGKKYKKK